MRYALRGKQRRLCFSATKHTAFPVFTGWLMVCFSLSHSAFLCDFCCIQFQGDFFSTFLEQVPKSDEIRLVDEPAQAIFDVIDTQMSRT